MDKVTQAIDHAKTAMELADKTTRFNGVTVEGMTSVKVRYLLHALCSLHGGHYLELGAWKGGTFFSACCGSGLDYATVIDNWMTFGGPREEFYDNMRKWEPVLPDCRVIDDNCWDVTMDEISPKVDIYFYDGHHHEDNQRRAITHFWPALAKPAIIVIDDWDDKNHDVPRGTRNGFKDVGAEVLLEVERHADHQADAQGWWNGIFLAVVQ